ncbi:unnamed protein product [Fraxinus pennsylvanica]|uniref:Uncharacterized protein n=1 Tax=Fraxinus pennsylvanica TaxID=56036 RepID=A0AAD2ECY4_9LAMI|nr:unnamed protein product [Fraxinus pennsylvanica]
MSVLNLSAQIHQARTHDFQHVELPAGAKIPESACAKSYEVRDSLGVIWIWMSHKKTTKTAITAKREESAALFFEVTERTDRGFAGIWGQGKAMIISRFGSTMKPSWLFELIPEWYWLQNTCKVESELCMCRISEIDISGM